jgi:hypothetical protein
MNISINVREVIVLTILFIGLALYYDIYTDKEHMLSFVIDHVVALLIALGLAKAINTIYLRYK